MLWKACTFGAAITYGFLTRKIDHHVIPNTVPKTIYLTRHAQAEHNVKNDFKIPDPFLTKQGEHQAGVDLPRRLKTLLSVVHPGAASGTITANGTSDKTIVVDDHLTTSNVARDEAPKAPSGETEADAVGHPKEALGFAEEEAPIELILVSPMKRTIQTALLGYASQIRRGVPVVVHPELQEVGAFPCDTGSSIDSLRSEFPDLDFSLLEKEEEELAAAAAAKSKAKTSGHTIKEPQDPSSASSSSSSSASSSADERPPWYLKTGKYHADPFVVMRRSHRVVKYLLERPEIHIAVVTHGGLLQWMLSEIRGFKNAEVRKYTLTPDRRWRHEIAFSHGRDDGQDVVDDTIKHEMEEVGKASS